MGKASKKMVRKQQKVQNANHKQQIEELKKNLYQQRNAAEYEKALEVLAELIPLKCYDPEVFYTGAYCYFMIGDYKRAAEWVNNTLSYAPNHVDARILLGRICILENRTEDGLSVLDFVLEHAGGGLTSAQKDTLDDILGYYGKYEMEKMKQHYSHIADFCSVLASPADRAADSTLQDIEEITASMDKLMKEQPLEELPEEPVAAAEAVEMPVNSPSDGAGSESLGTSADESSMAVPDLATIKQEILQKPVSFQEKIKMLNSFAAVCYFDKQYEKAESLLQEALRLDGYHEATLRNMAYTLLAAGRTEEALQYASKMNLADFGLLHSLQQ